MSDLPAADAPAPDNLSRGDALAMAGAWSAAIPAWADAVRERPELRGAVERRLRWFLAEAGMPARSRFQTLPLILLMLVAMALAAAFFMFAGAPGSTSADLLAVAIWLMTGIAAVAALLAARRSGQSPVPGLLARAREVAASLDSQPPTGAPR